MSDADNPNKPISEPNPKVEDTNLQEPPAEETTSEETTSRVETSDVETLEGQQISQESNPDLSELPELKLPKRPTPLSADMVPSEKSQKKGTAKETVKESDWFTLTRKLRRRNRDLIKKVGNLEQTLAKTQEALQKQIQRSRSANQLSAQHAQELQSAQEQVNRLFGELESSHQAAQRQQILIETLSEQLETSQERVAVLERQCALLQERCDEQGHKIVQVENQYQELHSRLQRQQRHTLQFKAALDKCLEIPDHNGEPNPETAATQRQKMRNQFSSASPIPKAQPIQPWSAQFNDLEELAETSPPWARKEFNDLSLEELSMEEPSPITSQSQPEISDLAEMEALEEGDFSLSLEEIRAELHQTRQSIEEISAEVSEVMEQHGENPPPELEAAVNQPETPPLNPEPPIAQPEASSEPQMPSVVSESPKTTSQPSSPSPIIYPLRSRKKVKSLAAIDLPSFPRLAMSDKA